MNRTKTVPESAGTPVVPESAGTSTPSTTPSGGGRRGGSSRRGAQPSGSSFEHRRREPPAAPRGPAQTPKPPESSSRTSWRAVLALVVLLPLGTLALSAQEPTTRDPVPDVPESAGTPSSPADASRDRATVRLRFDCRSEIGRREITLFANGTVRLREGLGREERFELGELSPDELAAVEARLAEVDLAEDEEGGRAVVDGPWVEQCRLDLLTAQSRFRTFSFSKAATLSLSLDRLAKIAEDVVHSVRPADGGGLPAGYQPVSGDELVRGDGRRFRVVALTADGKAVELEQIDEPLVLFVPLDQLSAVFVRREPRP